LAELKGNAPGGQKHQAFLLLPFISKRDVPPLLGSFLGSQLRADRGNPNNAGPARK